jgi:hypothetical protein
MGLRIEFSDGQKVEFGVATIPRRKRKALYKMRGCQMEVLAYFCSDNDAEEFDRLLDFVVDTLQPNSQP